MIDHRPVQRFDGDVRLWVIKWIVDIGWVSIHLEWASIAIKNIWFSIEVWFEVSIIYTCRPAIFHKIYRMLERIESFSVHAAISFDVFGKDSTFSRSKTIGIPVGTDSDGNILKASAFPLCWVNWIQWIFIHKQSQCPLL